MPRNYLPPFLLAVVLTLPVLLHLGIANGAPGATYYAVRLPSGASPAVALAAAPAANFRVVRLAAIWGVRWLILRPPPGQTRIAVPPAPGALTFSWRGGGCLPSPAGR